MNKRQAKIKALQIISEQIQAAIDSGAVFYGTPDRDGKKIEHQMELALWALDARIEKLVGA